MVFGGGVERNHKKKGAKKRSRSMAWGGTHNKTVKWELSNINTEKGTSREEKGCKRRGKKKKGKPKGTSCRIIYEVRVRVEGATDV